MGGFGSGRQSMGSRDTVEQCRSLDVNALRSKGCLTPGWSGVWQWSVLGEQNGHISLRTETDTIILTYRCRVNGDEWEDVKESVPIIYVPCHFGGFRPFFLCPGVSNGVHCGRRVAKLYGADKYFLCRHCYQLKYRSQSEGVMDRAIRRAEKIRTQLGGEADIAYPFPERPKGMWWRTYERLCEMSFRAETTAYSAMDAVFKKMVMGAKQAKQRKGFWE